MRSAAMPVISAAHCGEKRRRCSAKLVESDRVPGDELGIVAPLGADHVHQRERQRARRCPAG